MNRLRRHTSEIGVLFFRHLTNNSGETGPISQISPISRLTPRISARLFSSEPNPITVPNWVLVHICELVLMQDTSGTDGSPLEQECRHALLQMDHVISLLESLGTTTVEENEYKKLISAILKDARGGLKWQMDQCRAVESRIGLSTVEQHIKAATTLSLLLKDQPLNGISVATMWHILRT
jgi:hypothetical protein